MPSNRFDPIQGPGIEQTAAPGNKGGPAFSIDISEVMKFAYDLKGAAAPNIVRSELTTAMKKSVGYVRDKANARITSKSGKAKNSAVTRVSVVNAGIQGRITWTAKSDEGYPYPIVLESGHKAFGPKNKPILAWEEPEGVWHYAMWIKAWPGIQFASKGLQDAEGQVAIEFQAANARIVRQVESLGS